MTTAERKKLEEEARRRQKSLPLSSSYRKRMEEEALRAQRNRDSERLAARLDVGYLPSKSAEFEAELAAARAKAEADEVARQRRIQEQYEAQEKAAREQPVVNIADANRMAASVDYSPEAEAGRLKFERENPTWNMSAAEKFEYYKNKYNPLALGDMAINAAGAGAAQFGAQIGDVITAPFRGQARYPYYDAWRGKESEPAPKNDVDKYIKQAHDTLKTFQENRARYYLREDTLQDKSDEYSAKLGERYADLTDNAVTKALYDLSSATGYMIPTIISNAIIPHSGTALLFSAGFSSGERQALQEGASAEDARNYALLNGLNQSLGELLVGGIMGIGAGAIKSLALRAGIDLTKNIIHPGIRALANGILSGLGEGAEEIAQSGIDTLAKRATYDPNAKFDLGEAAYEGLIAGFMGTGGNAIETAINARNEIPLQLPSDKQNAAQTQKTGTQASRAQDYYNSRIADIKSREADLFGRLRTAEEDEIFNRLTTAKNNTEKSGILAGASDEVIAKASKVAEAGGVDILFERIERTVAGNIVDGYEYGGKLYINPESQRSVEFIQGHELTHSIEKAKSYDKLARYVLNRMGTEAVEAERQRIGNIRTAEGQALTAEQIDREIVADWAGRNLLNNEADIVDIVRTDRTLAERIKDWLTGMVKRFTGTTEEKFYSHARSLYIKALNEARKAEAVDAKAAASFRYSVSKDEPDTRKAVDISPDKVAVKEARRTIKELEAQNEKLRTVNEYQRKQFKRSDKNEPNARAVARYVKGLIKSYSSKTPVDAVAQKLTDLYTYIATGDENGAPVWDIMYEKARDIAGDIIGGSEALLNSDALETFSEIKNYFKGKKFYVPAENKADFGDFKAFKNKNFGRFILTTDPASGAKSVDAYYGELTELFGENYFPSEITNPTDQLQHISHVMDGMNAIYGNPFSGEAFNEVTAIVASDILDKFYDIPQEAPTFADKAEKRVILEKVKGQNKLDTLRESKDKQLQKTRESARERFERLRDRKNAQIEKIRQDLREDAARRLHDMKQKNDDKIAKFKADIRERAARARVNRSKTSLRKRIRRSCQRMIKMLAKPDKNRHIPDGLQESVAELFDLIASSPDEIVQTGDMAGTPKTDALKDRLAKVSDIYARMIRDGSQAIIDPALQDMFDGAKADLAETPWNKLGAEQLDNLYRLTKAIYKSITTANKAFRDAQNRNIDTLAEAVRVDNDGKKDRAKLKGAKHTADRLVNFSVLDPRRVFRRLGDTMYGLYRNIERGQDNYINDVTKYVKFMNETIKDIKMSEWDGDKAKRIKVGILIDEFAGTTKDVEFTPAMIMNLYLLNKRKQAQKHIGGIGGIALQLPGEDSPKSPIKISDSQINDIINEHMTPEMKRVANSMSEYVFNVVTPALNNTSREMYDYSKYTEQAYWPIETHKGSITKSLGADVGSPTLENAGPTKPVMKKANNALVVRSVFDVMDNHVTWAAAYNAYVPALADMRRVLNTRTENGTTVTSLLNDKHGAETERYISNFLQMVNSGQITRGLWNDTITKKLLRSFKGAKVAANLSVILKQPLSYIRAANSLNPKYLLQALKLETIKSRRKAIAEMLEYNPIARIKDWGYADMGFGKNMRQLYDKSAESFSDKAQMWFAKPASWADKVTWGRLWSAVKLEQQAKGINDVARWSERFHDIISETQVTNTIFDSPPILHEQSTMTAMSTMFMAEPIKSFNMLYEAVESKNAAQIGRTATTLITNTFVVALVNTAFEHLRRKEDEEVTPLSITVDVLENMLYDTLSMLPYVRDAVSILQGYGVERPDYVGIADVYNALKSLYDDVTGIAKGESARGTAMLHTKRMTEALSSVTGIPAGNIWREFESSVRTFARLTNNAGMEYLVTAALYNPENDSNRRYYYDLLYKYRNDDKVYEALKNRLIDEHGYKAENIEAAILSRWKKSGEYKSAYESEAARVMPSVEGNPHILELPKAEREEMAKQADTYAAAVARDRLDGDYELNASAKKIKDAVEDGLSVGEYLLYTNARKKADEALDDNGSYGVKEKVRAIRDLSWLNVSKQQALLILDTRTKDNPEGLANEIEAILGSGLSFDEFLNVYERHNEIYNEEDLSASGKALKFANWLDGRYTEEQSDIIQEHFGYWAGAKAVPTHYNKFTDAGIDIDVAYDLADAISKLEPVEGKKAVSSLQRYRVVVDAEISDNDKMRALSVLMPETAYKELAKARLKGLKIDSYVKYLEGTTDIVSDIKNGEPVSGSRKQKVLTYINRMLIPKAHKDLLYYIARYSEKTISDAPWRGGQKYSGDINGKKVNGRTLRKLGGA